VDGQPYDATYDGDCGRWAKLEDHAGPASLSGGDVQGSFPSSDRWQQV